MPIVCIMEFDKVKRNFPLLKEIEVASIPTKNDKIVLDIDGIGYIFEVYDVHYTDHSGTDVYVVRRSTTTEYNSSRFPDIP